jgi:hypothetical protein
MSIGNPAAIMTKEEIITTAYEESRYHRQFHHTLFGIYFALYLALLGYQLSNQADVQKIAANDSLRIPVALALYAFCPGLLTGIFIRYHYTIARLNSLIANAAGVAPAGVDQTNYDTLTFQKYKNAFKSGSWPLLTGRGHWFFLSNLWILAAFNLYVSDVLTQK